MEAEKHYCLCETFKFWCFEGDWNIPQVFKERLQKTFRYWKGKLFYEPNEVQSIELDAWRKDLATRNFLTKQQQNPVAGCSGVEPDEFNSRIRSNFLLISAITYWNILVKYVADFVLLSLWARPDTLLTQCFNLTSRKHWTAYGNRRLEGDEQWSRLPWEPGYR